MTRRISLSALLALASLPLMRCNDTPHADARVAPGTGSETGVVTSELQAGPVSAVPAMRNPYAGDDRMVAEGKQYFLDMNCAGCHGVVGGGGIGPPLLDEEWIYGGSPQNIYQSIVQGRPNGMPSYANRIPDDRLWMIVAYLQSISPGAGPGASPFPDTLPVADSAATNSDGRGAAPQTGR